MSNDTLNRNTFAILLREFGGSYPLGIEGDAQVIEHFRTEDPAMLRMFTTIADEICDLRQDQTADIREIKVCGVTPAEISRLHTWFESQSSRSFMSFWEEAFDAGVRAAQAAQAAPKVDIAVGAKAVKGPIRLVVGRPRRWIQGRRRCSSSG